MFQRLNILILLPLTIAVVSLMSEGVFANVVELPQEELAQESVLPKFDRNESVKKRNVTTADRFELGGYYGWNILEPIQNQSKFGLNLGYHWNERSAFALNFAMWNKGLNAQYTDGLAAPPPGGGNLDFSRAPELKYSLFGHYEWKIFYGKISLTKQGVLNLSTYPIIGLGMTAYEHKSYPGIDFGIGQKFYFSKNVALRADFKLQYGKQPSPFLQGKMRKTDTPSPQPGEFSEITRLGTILDVGLAILL